MLDSPEFDKHEGPVSDSQKPDALVSLVAEINSAHDAVCAALSAGLVHARRAGELLLRAKAELEHGDWLPWLTVHCPAIRERTAQGYMRVAREWSALEAKAPRVADLPLRQALALLADTRDSTSRDARPLDDDELASVLAEVGGSTDDEDDARLHRTELCALNRLLALPDLTLEEAAGMVHRAQEIEDEWFARRTRALSKLGVILNWADANGWGKVFRSLRTPEDYAALRKLLDQRIAELTP